LRVCRLVADHPRIAEGETEVVARLENESGERFTTLAFMRVPGGETAWMVKAVTEAGEMDACGIELRFQLMPNHPMCVVARLTERIVGLIRNEDEGIAGTLEALQRRNYSVDETEVTRAEWGFHATGIGIEDGGVENTVAVEKDSRPGHFVDSHFISCARRSG
jgi:hypothetical protein